MCMKVVKFGIAFFVSLIIIVACQESKMEKEGKMAVNSFLEEMNPELAQKIVRIEKEITLTEEKIQQLSDLKLRHPNLAGRIETSRQKWVHLQKRLNFSLKEIRDIVESTYVTYELDKIQGGKQFNQMSDKLLASADSILNSANMTKNVIEQALEEIENQPLSDTTVSQQESRSPQSVPVLPPSTVKSKSSIIALPTKLDKVLKGHRGDVNAIAFSHDGRIIASGSNDKTVKLWDVNTGKEIKTLRESHDDVLTVAFNPYEYILASGGRDRVIRLWDINTEEKPRTLIGHEGVIQSLAFSPDGRVLVSGSWDHSVIFWDINSARELRLIEGADFIYSVALSPDGRLIAVGSFDETITILEIETGKLLRTLQGHGMLTVYSVAFSPDGSKIISGDLSNNVRVWDTSTGHLMFTLKGLEGVFGGVFSVAFSPDGRVIASGNGDESLNLWDANTGEKLYTLRSDGNEVISVAFSPDGRVLASGHDDNTIKLWRVP